MNKKLAASTIALLMIIAMIPAMSIPHVSAQDECELFGDSPMCVFLHPGEPDAYKPGWSHTLGTLWGMEAGAAQSNQVLTMANNEYLDYAIIANSVGDLQFDIQVMYDIGYIEIYVPPEFKWLGPSMTESIWTDITNDYLFIQTITASEYDPIAPNWVRVIIGLEAWTWNSMTIPPIGAWGIAPGIYHIRLFNLQAPEVAGLYHFKIYTAPAGAFGSTSIGAGNFPFVIVKTELNPAYAEVTVRTHAFGGPDVGGPYISGWVHAEGTTPEGRTVEGVAYWGPMEFVGTSTKPGEFGALYTVYVFGLAAGTYTFTAEGSGFGPGTTDRITLEAGQSMHGIFILMYDSPDVRVTIYSKHGVGEIPWHNLWQLPCGTNDPYAPPDNALQWRDIMIELYDADNNLIAFWASNLCEWMGATKWIPETNELLGLHDDGGVIPESTVFSANLVDNWDLFYTPRMYPSTHWDGHVPWDTADYIAGWHTGQYTVEAFVTGYIMDEADAYQRTFNLAFSAMNVVFDLRRTNWIEPVMHLPSGPWISGPTTAVLTAEDAAGSERAAAGFTIVPCPIDPLGPWDVPVWYDCAVPPDYAVGPIVIEGWNGVFPNVGSALARGDDAARDPEKKDYGLNPTASTHSAGAVSLAGNPYTIKLYMSDMGVPSAGIVGTGWYNIVGGDPQVSIFLCNSPTLLSFTILGASIWISLRSVDFQVPAHSRPWTFPGSEIWVDFINEDGDVVDTLDPTIYGLIQDAGVPWGWGWAIPGNDLADGMTPFDVDSVNAAGMHEHLGVFYCGIDYAEVWANIMRAVSGAWRSTRLPAGLYTYEAHTHGYIMRRSFPVQIPFSGVGDIEADLIQGGQIRVLLEFKHEAEPTAFNGFVRMEVFNEAGDLVGANVYGQAQPNVNTLANGIALGGLSQGGYLDFEGWAEWLVVPGPASATGWPGYPSDPFTADPAQRAQQSMWFYGVPDHTWADWSMTTPCDANRLEMPIGGLQYFDVYGFYWYAGLPARTWAGGWPTVPGVWDGLQKDSGIRGSVDIPGWSGSGGGTYTVKIWAFDPRGPDNMYGTADDWRMYAMGWPLEGIEVPWGGANSIYMEMNNMASLRGTVHWFDMFGNLRALPWAQVTASPGPESDDVPAYSSGYGAVGAGPSDPAGGYIMWLPAGSHDLSISTSEAPQVWTSAAPSSNTEYTAVVSDGWVGGSDTQIAQSGTPIPELPSFVAPLALFAALAASVWLLRKRSINTPILMK